MGAGDSVSCAPVKQPNSLRILAHRSPTGRGKKRDAGVLRTGRLARVAGGAWGLRPRKAPLGARANRPVVAVMAACHSHAAEPPYRAFFRAPPFLSRCVEAWHRSNHPEDSRRQREPERRSTAQRAGKAERSDRRAREDYGWGWAGGVTKPSHARSPTHRPTTCAAASLPVPVPASVPASVSVSVSVSVQAHRSSGSATSAEPRSGSGRR